MERAGADNLPEDAERQGLGTPATRASILEKLVQMGFVERRGKQLLPTKDGHNLACVLPEVLTSPQLTAQWETELTAIAKGQADPEGFMAGIAEMTRGLIANYSQISEDAQKLFQTERVVRQAAFPFPACLFSRRPLCSLTNTPAGQWRRVIGQTDTFCLRRAERQVRQEAFPHWDKRSDFTGP